MALFSRSGETDEQLANFYVSDVLGVPGQLSFMESDNEYVLG